MLEQRIHLQGDALNTHQFHKIKFTVKNKVTPNGFTKFGIAETYSELNLKFSNLDKYCQQKALIKANIRRNAKENA